MLPKLDGLSVCKRIKNSLNIPIISILDTNCDPDLATIPIPGNDDAIRSSKYIVQKLADRISLGKQNKNLNENAE